MTELSIIFWFHLNVSSHPVLKHLPFSSLPSFDRFRLWSLPKRILRLQHKLCLCSTSPPLASPEHLAGDFAPAVVGPPLSQVCERSKRGLCWVQFCRESWNNTQVSLWLPVLHWNPGHKCRRENSPFQNVAVEQRHSVLLTEKTNTRNGMKCYLPKGNCAIKTQTRERWWGPVKANNLFGFSSGAGPVFTLAPPSCVTTLVTSPNSPCKPEFIWGGRSSRGT